MFYASAPHAENLGGTFSSSRGGDVELGCVVKH